MFYARQIAVTGPQAQEMLRAAPVLQYLVGAGLGRGRLVDPDRVELSNLHRQTLFRIDGLDQPKASAAARHIVKLNPEIQIEPIVDAFGSATASKLADCMDLLLDCADSFAASYIASDFCVQSGQSFIGSSVVGRAHAVGSISDL